MIRFHLIKLNCIFNSSDKYYKMIHTQYLSFMGSNRILSLIIFLTNIGHYDILIGHIRYNVL